MTSITTLVLFSIITIASGSNKLPSYIPRCRYSDAKCLCKVITHLIRTSPRGIPCLGIGSLDPHFTKNRSNCIERPYKVQFHTSNIRIDGIQKGVVNDVIGFDRDPKNPQFELHLSFPTLIASGGYSLSASLFFGPISNQGLFLITLYDVHISIKFRCSAEERDERVYMKIEKTLFESRISRMTVDLKHPILNMCAKQLYKDINNFIDEWFAESVENSVQRVFQTFPYDELLIS